jgi:hypothetical protein
MFFMALSAAILGPLFGKEPAVAWLGGAFVLYGYLVHLTLDEIYAVDFENTHIKKSFGTALKLIDYHSAITSGLMAAGVIGAFFIAPSAKPFVATVKEAELRAFFHDRLLPKERWIFQPAVARAHPGGEAPTGSIGSRRP